jgi:hypothetical protein
LLYPDCRCDYARKQVTPGENARELADILALLGRSGGEAPLPSRAQLEAALASMRNITPAPLMQAILTGVCCVWQREKCWIKASWFCLNDV